MASPAAGTPTSAATPPLNGAIPRLVVRRREASNPLVSRKPQRRPRPPPGARPTAASANSASSTPPVGDRPSATPTATGASAAATPEESDWHEYKLVTTKASLIKDLRHHVMRMQSKRTIDPLNPQEFTRPVRLHRRDPRAPLSGAKEEAAANVLAAADKVAQDEERVKGEADREKKEADKAATLEKIAPFGGAQGQKKNAFKKKTQQVYKSNEAEKKLRYEEFFPWFVEDFDNKNTWVGNLEASLSNGAFAMFVLADGAFRMVPIEKWYKFTETKKFKTMTIEEAEVAMKKHAKAPRWLMNVIKEEEKAEAAKKARENASAAKTVFTRKGNRLEKSIPKTEAADADDMDFDDDRFADDEEAPIMDGDQQENQEIERRIKKEQLSANFFDARDEREYDEEEMEKKKLEFVRRKHGKKVKKALMNREGNFTYDSDSDGNPYGSSEEEEDSEDEMIRKEEEKKKREEEEKKKAEQAEKELKEKEQQAAIAAPATATTTTTTSTPVPTPTVDPKAKPDAPKKNEKSLNIPSTKSLGTKRNGSPDLSGSGTESRKKPRKNQPPVYATSANTQSQDKKNIVKLKVSSENLSQIAATAPAPTATATSSAVSKKRKALRPEGGSGSGGEDIAGELSDGAATSKKQRIKITSGGRALSPSATVSRQASPAAAGGSRAGSPAGGGGGNRAESPVDASGFITDEEIKAILTPEGVTAQILANKFKNRMKSAAVRMALVQSLKRLTVTRDKKMYPK